MYEVQIYRSSDINYGGVIATSKREHDDFQLVRYQRRGEAEHFGEARRVDLQKECQSILAHHGGAEPSFVFHVSNAAEFNKRLCSEDILLSARRKMGKAFALAMMECDDAEPESPEERERLRRLAQKEERNRAIAAVTELELIIEAQEQEQALDDQLNARDDDKRSDDNPNWGLF